MKSILTSLPRITIGALVCFTAIQTAILFPASHQARKFGGNAGHINPRGPTQSRRKTYSGNIAPAWVKAVTLK